MSAITYKWRNICKKGDNKAALEELKKFVIRFNSVYEYKNISKAIFDINDDGHLNQGISDPCKKLEELHKALTMHKLRNCTNNSVSTLENWETAIDEKDALFDNTVLVHENNKTYCFTVNELRMELSRIGIFINPFTRKQYNNSELQAILDENNINMGELVLADDEVIEEVKETDMVKLGRLFSNVLPDGIINVSLDGFLQTFQDPDLLYLLANVIYNSILGSINPYSRQRFIMHVDSPEKRISFLIGLFSRIQNINTSQKYILQSYLEGFNLTDEQDEEEEEEIPDEDLEDDVLTMTEIVRARIAERDLEDPRNDRNDDFLNQAYLIHEPDEYKIFNSRAREIELNDNDRIIFYSDDLYQGFNVYADFTSDYDDIQDLLRDPLFRENRGRIFISIDSRFADIQRIISVRGRNNVFVFETLEN